MNLENSHSIFSIILAFGLVSKDKRTDKVMLTAYEVLKEPVTRILMGGNEDPAAVAAQNALNGVADGNVKSETPSVKKRHRRMKSSSNKANDLEGRVELLTSSSINAPN